MTVHKRILASALLLVLFSLYAPTPARSQNNPNPPPQAVRGDLSNVTFTSDITADVKSWPASITLSVTVTQDTVNYSYDIMDTFTPTGPVNSVGNGWLFVYRGNSWLATTVNHFRPNHGNDNKSIADEILCGGISGSPTFNGTFVPVQGEVYGFMVSGQARAGASPALPSEQQRSNVVMATWNSTTKVGNCGTSGNPSLPRGVKGPCPQGYIVLAGSNASGADAANNGFFCDNDPPEATNVTYPIDGIFVCDTSNSQHKVFASVGYVRCQTWDFSSGAPVYQNGLIAEASCGSNTPVTINDSNFSAGAFTTSPAVEGVICVPGIVGHTIGGGGGTFVPTGPPIIDGVDGRLTIAPGQVLILNGSNLGTLITLIPTNSLGSQIDLDGTVDTGGMQMKVLMPKTMPLGATYKIFMQHSLGSTTMSQEITIVPEKSTYQGFPLPPPPSTARSLGEMIQYIYLYSLYIVGLAVFSMMIWAGVLWFTSAGNASKISDAKSKIYNAIIGAILLLSAYLILYTINPDLVQGNFIVPSVPANKP